MFISNPNAVEMEEVRAEMADIANLQGYWTPRNYQKKLGICIEDCATVSEWLANTPYASLPVVSSDKLFQAQSLKFTLSHGGWLGIGKAVNYDFSNVSIIGIALWIEEEHSFDSAELRLTTDATKVNVYNNWTNYFKTTLGATSTKLHSGWNFIKVHKDNFTMVGTDTWGAFKAMNITFILPTNKFLNDYSGQGTSPVASVDVKIGGIYLNPSYDTPKLLIEFDDSIPSMYQNGYPYMRAKGIRGTVNVCRNHVSDIGPTYMTPEQHDELYASGWDMCAHSVTHNDEWSMSADDLIYEWSTILEWLIARGYTRSAFMGAYPQGRYNTTILNVVKSLGYKFMRGRNVGLIDHITPDEMLAFPTYEIRGTTPLATVTGYIDASIKKNSSVSIFTHGIVASNPDQYSTTTTIFQSVIDYAVSKRDAGQLDIITKSELYQGLSDKTINIPSIVTA